MAINTSQMKALLYKEYLTYKKSLASVLFVQIIIPMVLGYLLLVYGPSRIENGLKKLEKKQEEQTNSSKLFQKTLYIRQICQFKPSTMYFHPKTNEAIEVMRNVQIKCQLLNPVAIESKADFDKKMNDVAANRWNTNNTHVVGAVLFNNLSATHLDYELRPVDFDNFEENDIYRKQYSRDNPFFALERNPYLKSKFLAMQVFIDEAFLEMAKPPSPPNPPNPRQSEETNETKTIEIFQIVALSQMDDINIFKNMPVMNAISIYYAGLIAAILPLMVFMKSILDEKTSQMKKLLKLMAMRELEYWLAKCFFVLLIFIFLDAYIVFLVRLNTEDRVDVSLIFFVLLIYFLSSMFVAMALTTMYNVAIFGIAAFLGLAFLSSYPLWFFLKSPGKSLWMMFQGRTYLPEEAYLLMCVIIPPNFSLICSLTLIMEGNNYAFSSKYLSSYGSLTPRWWHLFTLTPPYRVLTLGFVMIASIASIILWFVIYLLLVQIFGADPDISNEFHIINKRPPSEDDDKKLEKYFEPDPHNLKVGIVMNKLTKKFSYKAVVRNLSLKLYYGQITVLLGHNGAGKSTLMNMISGLTRPTSGNLYVNGFDVTRDRKKLQGKVGLCPQKEILLENFTVEEQLYIFAILKGYSSQLVANEITRVLKLLNLTDKRKVRAMSLSTGMRRKLQFGISIVGGCDVLILDEPSSGLDVESRRLVWNLLRSLRKTFLIFMATHHMEEADCLADRVVVMADGHLICVGSTPFLKRVFNVGHHLRILSEAPDKSKIRKFVADHCAEAKLENQTTNEVIYSIPLLKTDKLQAFCQQLEKQSQNIGVRSFGLTATPLDDVFLNTYTLFKEKRRPSLTDLSQSNVFKKSRKTSNITMICALFLKRLQTDMRRWITLVAFIAMHTFITLVLFYMMLSFVDIETSKIREWRKQLTYNDFGYKNVTGFCSANKTTFCSSFNETATNFGIKIKEINTSPEDYIKEAINSDYEYYREHIVLGIEERQSFLTLWHLNQAPHSLPIGFNIAFNFLLKQLTNNPGPDIKTSTHTVPGPSQSVSKSRLILLDRTIYITPYALVYTILFASCTSTILLTRERFTKAKLLQYLAGATPLAYWVSNIIYDCFFVSVICSPFWIISFSFSKNIVFFNTISTLSVATGFIGFLLSNASLNFLMSQIFAKPSTAFVVLFLFNGISATVANEFFLFSKHNEEIRVSFIVDALVHLFEWGTSMSHFRLFVEVILDSMKATLSMHLCSELNDEDKIYIGIDPSLKDCDSKCKDCYNENYNPFRDGDPGALFEIIWIYVIFFGSAFMSLILEVRMFKHDFCTTKRHSSTTDEDVKAENELVNKLVYEKSAGQSKCLLLCHRLTKTFKGLPGWKQISPVVLMNPKKVMSQFHAVKKLSFSIKRNEFFGLLGVNGAGKTITFKMLTGDLTTSAGNAYLSPYSLLDNYRQYQQEIGYCPQQNVLFDQLTGRQTLTLFARIRGIPRDKLSKTVEDLLQFADLEQYSDTTTTVYSGGNMRKLSLAISLIGSPSILMLDEPTSGVDPFGRRRLWKALTNYKNVNSGSIILSSHSLDECEFLCNRIAILAKGTMQCIGSIQHLKSKYCQGYSVSIKANRVKNNLKEADVLFKQNFPNATVIDDHPPCIVYLLPTAQLSSTSSSISSIFRTMEAIKKRLDIEDYQISQMSLEHLFLKFSVQALHLKSKSGSLSSSGYGNKGAKNNKRRAK